MLHIPCEHKVYDMHHADGHMQGISLLGRARHHVLANENLRKTNGIFGDGELVNARGKGERILSIVKRRIG